MSEQTGETTETVDAVAEEAIEVESTEPVEEAPSGDDPPEKEKKKNSFQERINTITRQRKDAEQRAADAEARLARIEQGVSEADPRPKLSDFEYDEDAHGAALDEWHERRAARAAKAARVDDIREEAVMSRQAASQAMVQAFSTRSAEFAEEHPDYMATVQNPAFVQAPVIQRAVLSSEAGPALAYHLGKNLELTHQLNSMTPIAAAMELGRIEARLTRPVGSQTTSAPEPVRPVGNKAPVAKDPDKMSPDEYRRYREKQRRA